MPSVSPTCCQREWPGCKFCGSCGRQLDREPQRVITVRMPKSLHTALRNLAHERGQSINSLCVEHLQELIELCAAMAEATGDGGQPAPFWSPWTGDGERGHLMERTSNR